ncbi:thioredoxin domain-containing protein 15-like [Tropilaelaps mercedesae]|uniref:Thioredoxin domain-containing protein 15-like n=1 Tax=Tropilaelaps mercedesae TaxID=418985 RepID=A0A1V9XQV6_9ACAR|nr:thioredoxin domain-containing protein 15-like [Tropilaelaps mercedesae]
MSRSVVLFVLLLAGGLGHAQDSPSENAAASDNFSGPVPPHSLTTEPLTDSVNATITETPDNATVVAAENTTTPTSNANNGSVDNSRRVSCAPPEVAHDRLIILNARKIAQTLSAARNECSLLIFYSPHCMFSVRSAPYLNGIARYYPNISVLALPINESSSVNMKYGIVGVPTVLLLHNARAIAKLNHTNTTSLDQLAVFVEKHTGISPLENMTLLPGDFLGPLPCQVVERPNWLLLVAWIFTVLAFIYLLLQSSYAAKAYNWFVATWREAREAEQAQRPHQD